MKGWIDMTAEALRMLSFLTLLGLCTIGLAPLIGCEQKPATPAADVTTDDDIRINAPGVNVEIDQTPNADGSRDVDVNVNPGGKNGVDVDVDRTPGIAPNVDVEVDNP